MAKLQKKWLADDAVDGSKVKLNNDEALRARDNTNTADIDMFKLNTSDDVEFIAKPQYGSDPIADNDLARKAYVDAQIAASASGLEWQDSVIDILSTPPGSPTTGDRYLVGALATGAWAGDDDEIAEWTGSAWAFTNPTTGMAVLVDDELDGLYIYSGGWTKKGFEATTGGAGTTLNANAIDVNVDGSTIQINGSDNLEVPSGGIGSTQLSTNAVTTDKITDANVTEAKLASNSVTESKIASDVDAESFAISSNYGANASTGNVAATDSIEDAVKKLEAKADGSVQPGDNISTLTNDSNFIDSAGAPVQSVNTQTGAVVLDGEDLNISSNYATNPNTSGNVTAGDSIEDALKRLEAKADSGQNLTAGNGISFSGSDIDVNVDDTTIEINSDILRIKSGGVGLNQLATNSVNSTKLAVNSVTTAKINDDAVTEAKIGSDVDAETFLVATGYDSSTATGNVAVSDSIQAALEKIEKKADDASSATPNYSNQIITLAAGDITNGYIDLANAITSGSLQVAPKGGPVQEEGVDYTLSQPASVTRITFAGDLASELAAGDKLMCQYSY